MTTETLTVTGMTCGHCVSAVDSELRVVPGVTDVSIDLVAGGESHVQVTTDQPVAHAALVAAVNEAGYTVVGQDPSGPDGRTGLPLA